MIDAVKLIQFNTWANKKLLQQAAALPQEAFVKDLGGSFPSLQQTFRHLLQSDWIWMHRFKGFPLVVVPIDWQTGTALEIQSTWTPLMKEFMAEIEKGAASEDKELAFETKSGDRFQLPFSDLLVHVVNHGTYHRGQIVNMLRRLGEKPVQTDYYLFCSLQKQSPG